MFAATFTVCVPSLLSTLWIPTKILRKSMWRKRVQSNSNDEAFLVDIIENEEDTETNTESTATPKQEQLADYLKDEAKFEVFIDWIYREFSSEILLSFIEFTQFKLFVKEALRRKDVENGRHRKGRRSLRRVHSTTDANGDAMEYVLYDAMPRSSIVHSTKRQVYAMKSSDDSVTVRGQECDDITHCKHTAHLLYDKYIRNYAELQINISGELRTKFHTLDRTRYEGLSGEGMMRLFDPAMQEMYRYIKQSFVRLIIHLKGS